jgi:hypothetical protein
MFTTVLIRGDRLVAGKPTDALFALFRRLADFREPEEAHRISGSDGDQSLQRLKTTIS